MTVRDNKYDIFCELGLTDFVKGKPVVKLERKAVGLSKGRMPGCQIRSNE
jgi:hypothetical protein